ncbi:bacterio-opsin activator domain-containing protein [Halorussus marinus]|uniref:bacterio-opsin activator domain-containing protein n=1 Tax=Halorussus marinus TaxID=2505976 RepID=UPI001093035A|nr:bacterio-opsin activator domain-containing protein [Halorussus marinus]
MTDRDRTATGIEFLYVDAEPPPAPVADAPDLTGKRVDSAAAARERLTDGGIDCVVSEYDLPETDGIDLLASVRAERPDLPFVIFTDSGSETVASDALGAGATDYLPKSAGGEELCERIRRAAGASEPGLPGDRLRELTNAFPDVAFVLDEAGRYLEVLSSPGTAELKTYEPESLVGRYVHDAFADETADRFVDHIRATLERGDVQTVEYQIETDDGERWFEGRVAPLAEPVDGRRAVVWVARDVTDRRANERELAIRNDQLGTLTRINDLINRILQSLVESASREEIERSVCEGLANSEFYQFAWVAGPWVKDERTTPSVVVGADRDAVDRLVAATSARPESENAFSQVVSDGESVVIADAADADRLSERERECMRELGMVSAVLVPLSYGNTNHGVLGISGACTDTFGDRELTALETLGEVVAFAINAVKNRNLMLSDTAVELEFRLPDSNSVFGVLPAALDCRCRLEGFVPAAEDRLLEYVAVEGASASAVRDRLRDAASVAESRVVTDDDGCLLEIVHESSPVEHLVNAGTVVTSASADFGGVRVRTEAPHDLDVRSVVEELRRSYPDAELVSKRETNRPVNTAREFRRTLTEELTEKQRSALRAAYFAGYYDYPRGSTAEEVADSLGVSSPTLHQHLRAAQRKLVETFLD